MAFVTKDGNTVELQAALISVGPLLIIVMNLFIAYPSVRAINRARIVLGDVRAGRATRDGICWALMRLEADAQEMGLLCLLLIWLICTYGYNNIAYGWQLIVVTGVVFVISLLTGALSPGLTMLYDRSLSRCAPSE